LRRSLEEIVHRHEALRTTFAMGGEEPVQVIGGFERFELPTVNLDMPDGENRESEIARLSRLEAERSFDLGRDLLLRGQLLRLSEDEHVLLLTIHHIASDAWSRDLLFRELSELYAAYTDDRQPDLPKLTVQYADFAHWQREQLAGERARSLLDYWTKRLYGMPPSLNLPTDYPRAERQSYRGLLQTIQFEVDLTERIKDLGREAGATTFVTMLAVFQLLLSRLSGQRDVVVGVPTVDRMRVEVESLIGIFINNLVLRSDLSDNPSFRDLLAQVRSTMLAAQDHHEMPFEKLVQALQPGRDLSRTPLFQVLFNAADFGPSELHLPGIRVERIGFQETIQSKYDLTVYMREQDSKLSLELVYNADLFCPGRMEEMGRQFSALASQITENPDLGIDSYSLLTSESVRILPDPQVELQSPRQSTVVEQIAAWSEKAPDSVAINGESSAWTYCDLTAAARDFSRVLNDAGVRSGDAVALMGDPSFGLITSLLGVLNCGAVIVPIDRSLPAARVDMLLKEAKVRLLVLIGDVERDALTSDSRATIRVDAATGIIEPDWKVSLEDSTPSNVRSFPENAAYIFFTSGTTGTPKGVLGSHQSLSHFINWQRTQFDVGPNDRVAQVTGLSFDVMLREIFLPLTSGARLCIPERNIDSAGEFWHWMDEQQITILHSVPSRLQSWLSDVPEETCLDSMRWLFMAGEPLSDTLVRSWRSFFPGAVINLYGPTETTLAKLWYRISAGEELRHGIQPLGRPLPQSQALILSAGDRLCGIGELGEIVVRTPFRTLGYLRAEENEGRFIANPFGDGDEDVVYRTGDLGRYLHEGQIQITGRVDDQLKIRGVRVEPAEVAAVLSAEDGVAHGFVGASPGDESDRQLIAWVVLEKGHEIGSNELSSSMASRLPLAFVPSQFVFLDELPLTANGKVDRSALPPPKTDNQSKYIAPRNPMERQLASIWCEVLGIEDVGIHDNFFALGGHSLLAIQIKTRTFERMQVDLSLRLLFEAPTIAELAEEIET
jgi:amino acid adenylation domain-containing protein